MSNINISGYEFTDFQRDFERLEGTHSEQVRREPEVTYYDEYAKAELRDMQPELYRQWIEGWSRSYYLREKHMDAILQYKTPNTPLTRLDTEVWQEAIDAVKNELSSLRNSRALSVITDLDQIYYVQSSAAGYGYIGAKGDIYGVNHDRAIRRAKATLYSATARDGEGIEYTIRQTVPDVGYTRTQLADLNEKTKVRGVWGRAFHYILLEGTSARPLLESIMQGDTFIMIGCNPVIDVPRKLSEIAGNPNVKWMTAIDWSQFDATVSRFEMNTAFDIIKEKITFPDFDTEMAFELSRQLFIHKKIAAPDGRIYWSHKGIPSGSYYTSIIGSIVNRLRIEYLWRFKFYEGPEYCYTLGDDSLIGYKEYWDPNEIADLAKQLNWIMNPSKTECSTIPAGITFLGRTSRGSQNQRDLKKCLRLAILPEYPVTEGKVSAYRIQSIYEDSGSTSSVLLRLAKRLRTKYGFPTEEEIPRLHRPYTFM
nr:TPA_asm: RNA-dependent RNA polymerase [Quinoa-associated deltapartitivirus 2]